MTSHKRTTRGAKGATPKDAGATPDGAVSELAGAGSGLQVDGLVALCAELAGRALSLGAMPSAIAEAVSRSLGSTRAEAPRRAVQVVRLADDVPVPGYKTAGAVAWDIAHAGQDAVTVRAGRKAMLESGLRLHIPDPDVGAFLFPRSSTGWRGLALANTTGVIDTDYQGQLLIPVRNTRRRKPLTVEPGERVAQLAFMRVVRYDAVVVDAFDTLTERGEGGFGSTGRL